MCKRTFVFIQSDYFHYESVATFKISKTRFLYFVFFIRLTKTNILDIVRLLVVVNFKRTVVS